MASSAFCLCRATPLLIPYMFLATLVLPVSLSSGKKPTHTFCSGLSRTSSPAATAGEVERFLGAVSAGAHSAFHRSYNASLYIDAENRTMYAVAQCRPDVPASYCAACLAASSLFLAARAASCADSAVWHDRCFLRYSERDTSRFRGDELAATVFNSSGRPAMHGIAAVTGLLAAVMDRLDHSMQKRRLLGSTRAADGIPWGWGTANGSAGLVYGVARCAPGIARADCGRCLRGALAVAERDYNGSAGMQVLRLSCMARYESYPFYNVSLLPDDFDPTTTSVGTSVGTEVAPPRPDHTSVGPVAAAAPPDHTSVGTVVAPPAPEHPSNRTNITAPISPPNGRNAFPPAAHGLPAGTNSTVPTSGGPSPAAPPKEKSHRRTRILLIVLVATGVAVGAMLLSFWSHRKRRQNRRDVVDGMPGGDVYFEGVDHPNPEEDEDEDSTSCQPYSYKILEAATCHFSNSSKLGSGGFGTVYRGTLENGKEVAVKRLKDSKRSLVELKREVSIVAKLRHENIVRFLGYCFEEEGRLFVYEYLPNNSLDKFWNKGCQRLDWATWFSIIKGVARGLQFLHGKEVIHRDLKPQNVLLDENFNPKIADFDLLRKYNKDRTHESTQKVAGTLGYMAPECTSGAKYQFSIKSDVYSYGVLVLEIVTGRKITTFEGQNSQGLVEYVWQHWTERRACDVVDSDLDVEAAEQGQRQALRCVHVALLCVQSDRSRRPTMGEVIAMVSTHQDSVLPAPSLPGYLHPKSASGRALRPLPCFGCN